MTVSVTPSSIINQSLTTLRSQPRRKDENVCTDSDQDPINSTLSTAGCSACVRSEQNSRGRHLMAISNGAHRCASTFIGSVGRCPKTHNIVELLVENNEIHFSLSTPKINHSGYVARFCCLCIETSHAVGVWSRNTRLSTCWAKTVVTYAQLTCQQRKATFNSTHWTSGKPSTHRKTSSSFFFCPCCPTTHWRFLYRSWSTRPHVTLQHPSPAGFSDCLCSVWCCLLIHRDTILPKIITVLTRCSSIVFLLV